MSTEDMHEYLINYGIATDDEISLVSSINGYHENTMEDIVYVKTGYRNFEQLKDEVEA